MTKKVTAEPRKRITITIPRSSYTDAPEPGYGWIPVSALKGRVITGFDISAERAQTNLHIERRCICCGAPESEVSHD